MIKKSTLKHLWPFFLYKLLKGSLFVTTITFFVFFLEKGITYFQASVLLAIQMAMPVIFEVITGLIADTFGRKISVLLGMAIELIILGGIILFFEFHSLVLLFVLWGITGTFASGADDAWALERIPEKDHERMLDEYYSTSTSAFGIGFIIAGALSTLLLSYYDQSSVWFARMGLIALMILILLFTKEQFKRTCEEGERMMASFVKSIKESWKHFAEEKRTRNIILGELFVSLALVAVGGAALQDYLIASELPTSSWGSVYSIAAFIGLSVPFLAMVASRRFSSKKSYLITVLTVQGFLFVVASYILNPFFAAFFILAHNLAEDLFNPVSSAFFQQKIPSKIRATMSSFHSMALGTGSMIGMLGGGYLANQVGGQMTMVIATFFLIPAIVFYYRISS